MTRPSYSIINRQNSMNVIGHYAKFIQHDEWKMRGNCEPTIQRRLSNRGQCHRAIGDRAKTMFTARGANGDEICGIAGIIPRRPSRAGYAIFVLVFSHCRHRCRDATVETQNFASLQPHQSRFPRQQFLHHPLLEGTSYFETILNFRNFCIHI